MAEPFIGEIMLGGFDFAPKNYSFADGSILMIQQNSMLYSLIGTYFGGNGSTTFGLPNLASTAACGSGTGPGRSQRILGTTFGEMAVVLTPEQTPSHTHLATCFVGRGVAEIATPTPTSALAASNGGNVYGTDPATAPMASPTLAFSGGGQMHDNRQPYLGITWCIALAGNFPSFP